MRRRALAVPAALFALGLLAGCSSGSSTTEEAAAPASECSITASDTWVKAADSGMTAAFGTLANSGSEDVTLVSAESDAAGRMEIHEVVDEDGSPIMRQKEGGLVIPAGGEAPLAPGADHLMLMEIPAPIKAGDTVDITLTCAEGGTSDYSGIAKPFEGADEEYQPGMEMDGDEMDGGEMDGDEMDASASPTQS